MPASDSPASGAVESPLPIGDAGVPPGGTDIAATFTDPTLIPNEISPGDTDATTVADAYDDTPAPTDTTDEPDPDRNHPNTPDSDGDPTLRATHPGSPLTTAAPRPPLQRTSPAPTSPTSTSPPSPERSPVSCDRRPSSARPRTS
jgi:hypothetical protein